jgi:hypothetical protein
MRPNYTTHSPLNHRRAGSTPAERDEQIWPPPAMIILDATSKNVFLPLLDVNRNHMPVPTVDISEIACFDILAPCFTNALRSQ